MRVARPASGVASGLDGRGEHLDPLECLRDGATQVELAPGPFVLRSLDVAQVGLEERLELLLLRLGDEGEMPIADGADEAGGTCDITARGEPGGDGVEHIPHPHVAAQQPIPRRGS